MNNNLKVLIVDDDPINLDIIEEMLDQQCQTCLAQSGEEALDKVSSFGADLVLLDVMMPGINGYETCIKMRNNPALNDLKIIMISAKASRADVQKGLDSGADEYVAKPFNEENLIEVINRYVH